MQTYLTCPITNFPTLQGIRKSTICQSSQGQLTHLIELIVILLTYGAIIVIIARIHGRY